MAEKRMNIKFGRAQDQPVAVLHVSDTHSTGKVFLDFYLNLDELKELLEQGTNAAHTIRCVTDRWVYATRPGLRIHLLPKDEQDPYGVVLCGERPPRNVHTGGEGWTFEPFVGDPVDSQLCHWCLQSYKKHKSASNNVE